MFGGWRRFNKEKPKTKNPLAYLKGKRGVLSFEKGSWKFISGNPKNRRKIHESLIDEILFMDNFK